MISVVRNVLCFLIVFSVSGSAFAGGNVKSGEKLATTCAACHGADGNSASATFPKLAGLGDKYLLKQLKDIRSGARPVAMMTGMLEGYSDQQLADIAAFFDAQEMQLSGSKDIKVQVNSGMKVDGLALGARIYRAGNHETGVPSCTGCHSPRGLGNSPALYPRLSGQHADYISKQLKDFRAGNRTNDSQGRVMRSVAKNMNDAEIEALANFIAGLH
ncbi:MAG: cytochrome c4 [Alteromonadaceae bacterium]|nr:MAG: cytochrome c4 [Alteromonadaceae bacterium]